MNDWIVDAPSRPPRSPRPPGAAPRPSFVSTMIGAAGFFLMMGLGGALAVYVFADRVVLILHR